LSENLHNSLKQWLVELGKQAKDSKGNVKYEAYSGDSQALDIRYGKKHVEYNPDVVWNRKGRLHIIELAFSENWRSIVGEIALASMVKNSKLLLVTTGFPNEFIDNLVPMFGKKLGVHWTYYNFEEPNNLREMKKDILKWLKDLHWL
jgi:hypothetical protein